MSTHRDRQKLAQLYLKEKGFYKGDIDGLWGKVSESAYRGYQDKINPTPKHADISPPASDYYSVSRVFGRPGDESNLVRITFPYPMRLAWDVGRTVKTSRCHKLIKKPLLRVLQELLDTYGSDWIKKHGLDKFGGIYNNRSVRGGRSKSKHAWGIAIDLDPNRNGLRVRWANGKQGRKGFASMPLGAIKIFEKHGFKSAARAWGRDAMHFEFTS